LPQHEIATGGRDGASVNGFQLILFY